MKRNSFSHLQRAHVTQSGKISAIPIPPHSLLHPLIKIPLFYFPNCLHQDAVEDLLENRSLLEEAGAALKKLPDLERLLSRIHAMGSKTRHENHPDGRAVIFEADIFDKRKIEDFIKVRDRETDVLVMMLDMLKCCSICRYDARHVDMMLDMLI